MNEIKALEHPTLKVPYEVLNKKYRQAQKVLDGEARQVANVVTEVENGLDRENVPAGDIKKLLGGMVERLQTMKRKASEAINEELSAGCVCKRRLDHLKEHAANIEESDTTQSDDPLIRQAALSQWRKTRLDRMLVDYFLRYGYYNAANQLADAMDIRDLTNVDIFRVAADVEGDLEKHNTTRCLQWCQDNKSKLRKLKSNMEFNVRIQEFIEMVRQDRRLDAVKYARRHFSVFEQDQLAEIQHCMGMLAFPKDTEVEPYAGLLSTTRWGSLVEQFRSWHWKLLQPAQQPALAVALQVGLAALKTPQCYSTSGKVASCPVCSPPLNQLAAALPHAHCSQSRLVCRISGEPLNEHNHPMMLPNGQVYGEKALKEMMKEHGAIICPKTKEVFCMKRVEKVFVM